ncbi:type II secretion system protein [Sulfurovum sp.]|uniref:type II secretion system protein n=1 Tax=Sulfurovum sp. TaxID=1969726 RepID=UPI0025E7B022|nr:type II secretion system protein [Sulfurovum sp.]
MRKAFSMITAIFVIVMMASVAMLVFNMSGKVTKSTSFQYREEQAALLAKSYTELAVLAVINHDRNSTGVCIQNINGVVKGITPGGGIPSGISSTNGGGYLVQTRIYYIGNDLNKTTNIGSSYWLNKTMPLKTNYNTTTPPLDDAVAAIIVDVSVRYKDPDVVEAYTLSHGGSAPSSRQIPWVTYHRRTLQKI